MADRKHTFDDGDAYEQYMGRWTHAVGAKFLDWLAPPAGAAWLDVGCGTGAFTELAIDSCSPASMVAIDPADAQIEHALGKAVARRADFRVADAQELPFADETFDIVVSALAINFIPDRARAIAEMRRVCRRGGLAAGFVWDFADERQPARPLRRGMRAIGIEPEPMVGESDSSLEGLLTLFARAGLEEAAVIPIEVTISYSDFDDFWQKMTIRKTPAIKRVLALPDADLARLADAVRAELSTADDGGIVCSARGNAIKARVPG